MADQSRRLLTKILIVCTALFFLRVVGQLLAAIYAPSWLPPMEHWYSGLIPYPVLIPIQVLILMLMPLMINGFAMEDGRFRVKRRKTEKRVVSLSVAYFGVMVLRYVVTMTLHPEKRWLVGSVPIALHMVLATFLFIWGRGSVSK